jgi:hypothetical protein
MRLDRPPASTNPAASTLALIVRFFLRLFAALSGAIGLLEELREPAAR